MMNTGDDSTLAAITNGVDQAFWDFIHNSRDYSTLFAIEDGVAKSMDRRIGEAVENWLDNHPDVIRDATKEAVIEWLDRHGGLPPLSGK